MNDRVRVPVRFDVENLYELSQKLLNVHFYVHDLSGSYAKGMTEKAIVLPDYRKYTNPNEVRRYVDGQWSFPVQKGEYALVALVDGRDYTLDTVSLTPNVIGKFLHYIPHKFWEFSTYLDQLKVLVFFVTLTGSIWWDQRRYAKSSNLGNILDDFSWRAALILGTSIIASSFTGSVCRVCLLYLLYLSALLASDGHS